MRNLEDNALVPVLTGCTASGKTEILLELRRRHEFEIISADSRQVYRGMDIGTAKPGREEQSFLTHHLIDEIELDETFSAGMFSREAWKLIHEIRSRNVKPLVAGGTALYLMALTGGLDSMPSKCEGIREGLMILEEEIPGVLYRILERVDPETSGVTGDRDLRRQIRALELYFLTGEPPSSLRRGGDPMLRQKFRIVGISVPEEKHRRKIRARAEGMIRRGLIDEVQSLLSNGWERDSILGETIGYSEVLDFLEGSLNSVEDTIDAIAVNTWHLVRRQKNMFKRIDGIIWVEDDLDYIENLLFWGGF